MNPTASRCTPRPPWAAAKAQVRVRPGAGILARVAPARIPVALTAHLNGASLPDRPESRTAWRKRRREPPGPAHHSLAMTSSARETR